MDREKVIRAVDSCFDYWLDKHVYLRQSELEHVRQFRADALILLKEQPDVVRCKDCRWGDWSRNGKGEKMILCYNGDTGIEDGYLHEPDWFCAEGERKDGA